MTKTKIIYDWSDLSEFIEDDLGDDGYTFEGVSIVEEEQLETVLVDEDDDEWEAYL